MYTAAILTPESVDLLYWVTLAITKGELESQFKFETHLGELLPHHMTINLGKFDEKLNPKWIQRQEAILIVDQLRWSEEIGACAFRVKTAISTGHVIKTAISTGHVIKTAISTSYVIKTINDNKSSKHITACLKPGTKAFKSNDLYKNESDLGFSIQYSNLYGKLIRLNATIQECA